MKKFMITTCGAILVGLLMISSATAVPKVYSDPLMNIINEIEKNKKIIEENISNKTLDFKTRESINLLNNKIKDTIYDTTVGLSGGILLDLLIKIIQWLISFIQKLINLLSSIFDLVELIYTLLTIIKALYDIIIALINFIRDIFTPEAIKST